MAVNLNSETGTELLSRLTAQKTIESLDTDILGKSNPGEVIEVLGDANSGKTEFLYHLCAKSVLPPSWKGIELNGLEIGVLFIDADQKFSVTRLMTILENRLSSAISHTKNHSLSTDETVTFLKSCLSRVNVINCRCMDELIIILHGLDEILSSQGTLISLILIDSISAYYWSDRMTYSDPSKKFYDYYAKLSKATQQVINTYKPLIVATKQTLIQSCNSADNDYDFMGRSWEKLVTKRLKFVDVTLKKFTENKITKLEIINDSLTIKACISNCGLETNK